MKQLVGALMLLLSAALVGLLVLRIWGVAVVSQYALLRSGATLLVLGLGLVGLIVVWFGFFTDPRAGYKVQPGRRVHPKATAEPEREALDLD